MKHLMSISILSAATLFVSCGNKDSARTENLLTVDVLESYPKKEFILQDLFDIEYIPLETKDEFITYGNLQDIDNENLLIRRGKNEGDIYFTDRKGRYLKTINRRGQGNEEYISSNEMFFDKENQELYVNDAAASRIQVYDLDGNYKRTLKSPAETYFKWIGNMDDQNIIVYCEAALDPDEQGYEMGKRKKGFKLVNKQDGTITSIPTPFKVWKSSSIIRETTQGRVYYAIQNKSMTPNQGSWIIDEISSDPIYSISSQNGQRPIIIRKPPIQDMDTEVYLYLGVQTDRYCFMQTVDNRFDFEKNTGFVTTELVYDKSEREIYEYLAHNNDLVDGNPMNLVNQIIYNLRVFNKNDIAFTARLHASDLIEAYKENKLRGQLKEIAATLGEEDNPVIMVAKYKKNGSQE